MPTEPKTITLILADDHPVAREGVRGILAKAPDIQILGEAENGNGIKDPIPKLHPDILLLDLKMPGTSPFEIEKWVRENYPETITLVLTAHDRDIYLAGIMDAGAAGYLSKSERAENLIAAIRRAASGESLFTHEQYHISAIFDRLDVDSRHEAVNWYQKHFPKDLSTNTVILKCVFVSLKVEKPDSILQNLRVCT